MNPFVLIITGPTATGKTALSVRVCELSGGEVVSADSMQLYKELSIGTAKPSQEEMRSVPHHMVNCIDPRENYSAARYVEDASACCDNILARGRIPVVTGGTNLYIDSLLSGRSFSEESVPALRSELTQEYDSLGGSAMLEKLRSFDPEAAERLHSNDKKRIIRAIEVFLLTGTTITEHDKFSRLVPPRYDSLRFAISFENRQDLYDRINQRVEKMRQNGLTEEVRSLLDSGLDSSCTAMQAIGYKELVDAIRGNISEDDAYEKIKLESRRYAKRQLSWLRRDESINWIIWDKIPDIERAAEMIAERCRAYGEKEACKEAIR